MSSQLYTFKQKDGTGRCFHEKSASTSPGPNLVRLVPGWNTNLLASKVFVLSIPLCWTLKQRTETIHMDHHYALYTMHDAGPAVCFVFAMIRSIEFAWESSKTNWKSSQVIPSKNLMFFCSFFSTQAIRQGNRYQNTKWEQRYCLRAERATFNKQLSTLMLNIAFQSYTKISHSSKCFPVYHSTLYVVNNCKRDGRICGRLTMSCMRKLYAIIYGGCWGIKILLTAWLGMYCGGGNQKSSARPKVGTSDWNTRPSLTRPPVAKIKYSMHI